MEVFTVVKRNPFVIPLAFIAALAMVFISEGSYWRTIRTLDSLGTLSTARFNILRLERALLDVETGQRGYLLTGRKEYLTPYADALRRVGESFKALDDHYGKSPSSAALVAKLRALTDTKLSEVALTVRLYDEGKRDITTELLLSGIGQENMESIRQLTAKLLDDESTNMEEGRLDVYRTMMISRIGVALLSAISLLALVMYLRESFALEREQQQQKRLIQAERDQLEMEVAQRTEQLTELTHHLQTAREDERSPSIVSCKFSRRLTRT